MIYFYIVNEVSYDNCTQEYVTNEIDHPILFTIIILNNKNTFYFNFDVITT